ncbi:MAG: hypothetical protein IIX61_09710 [Loktanella sp.]|nr:hypothetical protein [Loktanella sp.]
MITIAPDIPVLIAGPTAAGKSALALRIATRQGGVIVNADASQVFDGWQVLTARPPAADLAQAPHALYGHIAFDAPYSAGEWLREITPFLQGIPRPIIVGESPAGATGIATASEGLPENLLHRHAAGATLGDGRETMCAGAWHIAVMR